MRMLRCKPRPKGAWKIYARYTNSRKMRMVAKKVRHQYKSIYFMREGNMTIGKPYLLYIKK